MRKRRIVATALSSAMVASLLLTGCGNKGNSTETTAAGGSDQTEAATEAEPLELSGSSFDGILPTDLGLAKVGNGEKLIIGIQQNTFVENYDENWFTNYLEEQLGVEIEFYLMPADANDFRTQMSLIANSGADDMPDVIFTFGALTDVQIQDYGSKGLFLPLEDYINDENMSPHIAAIPEEDKEAMLRAMTSADGHIYGMAKYEPESWNLTPYRLYLNTAWLDKLGLEKPTTTDELKEVLTAFVNEDPNGNGQKDELGVYGFAEGGYGQNTVWALMNSFVFFPGENSANNGLTLSEDGKTVIAPFATDEWKKGLEYLKDLYDNGLLVASIFSDEETQFKATLNADTNIVGLVSAGSNSGSWQDNENNPNFLEMELVEPFIGPDGVQYTPYSEYSPTMDFFITSAAADRGNAELAYRFGESFYDFSLSMANRFGEIGVDWTVDEAVCDENSNAYKESGIIDKINLVYNYKGEKQVWSEVSSQFWHNVGPRYSSLEMGNSAADGSKEFEGTKVQMLNAQNYELYNGKWPEHILPKLKYTEEESNDISQTIMSMIDFLKQSTAEFVTGTRTLDDAGWQGYLNELDSLGLQTWLEHAQTAFERSQE